MLRILSGKKQRLTIGWPAFFCTFFASFERREFLPRWGPDAELLTLSIVILTLERKKNLPE
jgi:hypothetical protein